MSLGPFTKQDHLQITALGTQFALTEMVCAYGGYWADKKLDTSPWLLVAGVVVGFAMGMYEIISAARRIEKSSANLKKADKKDGRR